MKSRKVSRKFGRLINKVQTLKDEINVIRISCSESEEDIIEEAICALPKEQQIAIKTCFSASKVKSDKGMRYTSNWIYECILLRIKSKKT